MALQGRRAWYARRAAAIVVVVIVAAVLWYVSRPEESRDRPLGSATPVPSALRGEIYLLAEGTQKLPDFATLRPVGTIYATELNVPPRSFADGFPGVTDRFEWFAIDYRGAFVIREPGEYAFRVLSDDGARLSIDDAIVVDNDGVHPAWAVEGKTWLAAGVHSIRLSYFQGPRTDLALVLEVARAGGPFRPFNTRTLAPNVRTERGDGSPR